MKKAMLIACVTAVLLLCTMPATAESQWYIGDRGVMTGYIGDEAVVTVPTEIDGVTVTAIGDSAFRSMTTLEQVTIPDGIVSIGKHAFYACENLKSVTIPDSVEVIDEGAFGKCYALEELALPQALSTFDPLSLHFCRALHTVTVPEDNEAFTAKDGVLFTKDGETLLYYPPAKTDTTYTVPDGVTTVAAGAFEECNLLETVVFPDGLQTVEAGAFLRCEKLAAVSFDDRESAWEAVSIGDDNEPIANADVSFKTGLSVRSWIAIIGGPLAALAIAAILLKKKKDKRRTSKISK